LAEEAARVFTGMFNAAMYFDLHRVPELFCGFPRDEGEAQGIAHLGPACLGLSINRIDSKSSFVPLLPPLLNEARILNLQVAGASVDLAQVRHKYEITVNVLRRKGDIQIVAVM
jgi:hypothetical protein